MSLHRSPRFARSLVASLLMLGLIVVTIWVAPQRPSTAHAASTSLVQVANFGTNPTNLQMYLYVPSNVKPHPAILLALHYCTGSGPAFFSGTEFANLADQYGFIVIYPSVTRSGMAAYAIQFMGLNISSNGTIAAGGNTTFGFNGAWNGSNTNPATFTLNGVNCTAV